MTPPSFLGPLSLLAGCLLPVVGALGINSARPGLICVGLELLAFGWLVRDLKGTGRRLLFGLVAAMSITVSTYLYGGADIDESLGAAMRILFIVLPSAMLTPLLRPSALGDHLAQRLRLPPRVVVAAVAALQRVDSLGEEWRQVQRARRARGLGLDGGPIRRVKESAASAFALLVVSMRHAGSLSVAMDSRGFAGATERTWAEAAPWRWGDSGLLLIAFGLAAAPWLIG